MTTSQKPAARAAILAAWATWRPGRSGLAITSAAKEFAAAYAAAAIPCEPWVRAAYPNLTFGTLYRWLQTPKVGPVMLQALPARRDRPSAFDAEPLRSAVIATRAKHPRVAVATLREMLCQALPGVEVPTARSLCRYLRREHEKHPQRELVLRSPDAWRSTYLSAAGSYSHEVAHPNALWETDATLGDVELVDAHGVRRYSIIGLIDVFTRRVLFLVTKHSRTSAVLSLLRIAMFTWGMPSAIKTDRGAEFMSQHFKLAMLNLGIEHRPCDPYSPQQKPHIERVFGTLTRQLFELLPGYVGHSVAERKELESRKSFAQRMRDNAAPQLRMSQAELQLAIDKWTQRYEARKHTSLHGQTPMEMAAAAGPLRAADERALDALLLPVSNEGARTVGKKGVQVGNATFNHADLGGHEGRRVLCFLDEADPSSLYVYDAGGAFICKAVDSYAEPQLHAQIAAERRNKQLKLVSKFKAEAREAEKRFDVGAAVRSFQGLEEPAARVVALPVGKKAPAAPAQAADARATGQPDARTVQRAQAVLFDLFPDLVPQAGAKGQP